MANTPLARQIAIEMICDEGADVHQVNAAIGGDGSSISEGSWRFIKNACKWFKKYPQLIPWHCGRPANWDKFKEAVEILESGGTLP